ncbi:MAG: hypothetical protein KKF56_01290 [Nanoarchaeota archaeon]|nr:hypothetical protein [Nanoarchaeota archaeon]
MITESKPLDLTEAKKYIKESDENKEIIDYLKKFSKLKEDQAVKLKEELEGLKLMKLNQEHIVKIVDFAPEDEIDLMKVLQDVNLDGEEIKLLLDTVKKYVK